MKLKDIFTISILLVIFSSALVTVIFLEETFNLFGSALLYVIFILILVFVVFGLIRFLTRSKDKKIDYLQKQINEWSTISYRVKVAGDKAFTKFPIGILFFDTSFNIKWANRYADDAFKKELQGERLQIVHSKMYTSLSSNENDFIINVYDKRYKVKYQSEDKLAYLFESTNEEEISDKYRNSLRVVAHLNLDNYNNAVSNLDVQERAKLSGSFQEEIAKWGERFGMMIYNYSDSNYLALFDFQHLMSAMVNDFSILNIIREKAQENDLAITVSMGIACHEVTYEQLDKMAKRALELALSRGGDQVVVNIKDGELKYFGGKSNTVEKKSKIRARVISSELVENIKQSDNVIIMGHEYPDVDALGSSIALLKIVEANNVKGSIVIDRNKTDVTTEKLLEKIDLEHVKLKDSIITPDKALDELHSNTLLICVDFNNPDISIFPTLIDKAKRIVVIDHHRRGIKTIEGTSLYYVEPYASSSVELVVELLKFYSSNIQISSFEAIIMMMGIIVDTNNFTYRTGARTFEVASSIREYGADTVKAQILLRESLDTNLIRHKLLSQVQMFKHRYAIIEAGDNEILNRTLIAQVTDSAIEIENVDAAFTVAKISSDRVSISARSFGEVNVQVIMEQLGGGGHLNNAGSQFTNKAIPEVADMLREVLEKNETENSDKVKVLLIRDSRNNGKSGDIIEVTSSYATYLTKHRYAMDATPENIKNHEIERQRQDEEERAILQEKRNLRKIIEEKTLVIYTEFNKSGKLAKQITTDFIVEEFFKQFSIQLDKNQISFKDDLHTLGVHKIPIQLHKQVHANISIEIKVQI